MLSHLPGNVHLISHVHPKGALYAPPPPPTKLAAKARHAKKAERLPGMAAWADDPKKPWTELSFDQFGLHAKLAVKTQQALYYKAGGSRLLTICPDDAISKAASPGLKCSTAPTSPGTCGKSPVHLCLSLGHRVHFRNLQTIAWPGRPGQSLAFGCCSHRQADGVVSLQYFDYPASPSRACLGAVPETTVVSKQTRALLCRRPDDTAACELRGKNRTSGAETVSLENLAYATDRVFQPRGITAAVSDSSHQSHSRLSVEGRRLIAKLRTEICETRT